MRRKLLGLLAAWALTLPALGQGAGSISIIDFVRIRDGLRAEALYYYEQNWRLHREVALRRGVITGYRLLTVPADTVGRFDLLLITDFADTAALRRSEPAFQQIIKENRPNGPALLNARQPAEFRQLLFSRRATTVAGGAASPPLAPLSKP